MIVNVDVWMIFMLLINMPMLGPMIRKIKILYLISIHQHRTEEFVKSRLVCKFTSWQETILFIYVYILKHQLGLQEKKPTDCTGLFFFTNTTYFHCSEYQMSLWISHFSVYFFYKKSHNQIFKTRTNVSALDFYLNI
jgi:hypothetical protein